MEWQPIETAPKDGTVVMLWVKNWRKTIPVMIGWYGKITFENPAGWVGEHCKVNHIDQPTHWMPLPPPPNSKEK